MTEVTLEDQVIEPRIEVEDFGNKTDEELVDITKRKDLITTSQQLDEAKKEVDTAKKNAKTDYLSGRNGVVGKINSILFDMGILTPEKALKKNTKLMMKKKVEVDSALKIVNQNLSGGYQEINANERCKTATDALIIRHENKFAEKKKTFEQSRKFLENPSLDQLTRSGYESAMNTAYLEMFSAENEVKRLMCEYVLMDKHSERLRNVLEGSQRDVQVMMRTKYDLESELQSMNILLREGVSPEQLLSHMDDVYSLVEECNCLTNHVLRKSNAVSKAISGVRIVADRSAAENDALYKKKGDIARKVQDGFELEYAAIKERQRRS